MDELALDAGRLTSGLLAGVYLAFLVAVMPALHALADDLFVRVMNRTNEVIVNPAFLVLFLGAPLTAVGLVWWHRTPMSYAAAGAAGVALLVTFAANIPLNDALARTGSRGAFETPWLVWHGVRTLAALTSFVLLTLQETP
jgi:uncharacterized membrane protein